MRQFQNDLLRVFIAEQERIAEIFEPGPRYREVRQPELGSRILKGQAYINFRNREFGLDEEETRNKREIFEAFLQPKAPSRFFVPTNKAFFQNVMSGNPPLSAYKGVSYNPLLTEFGERLQNIDFFSWAKRVQQKLPDFQLLVYDAGIYQVINELDENLLPKKFDDDFAVRVLDLVQEGYRANSRIRDNTEIRNRYLNAILAAGNVSGTVVDAVSVMTPENTEFVEALQQTLNYCRKQGTDKFVVDRFVEYERYGGGFAKTYTPVVLAEALWFLDTAGNDLKFGPISERAFDAKIRMLVRETRQVPYQVIWYTRLFPESLAGFEDQVFFSDTSDTVRKKIGVIEDKDSLEWIISPFLEGGPLEERIVAFMDEVNSRLE